MGFRMKTSIFFFFMAVQFYFTFGEKNSSEDENPNNTSLNTMSNDEETESKGMEKNSNVHAHQRKPNYLITPDQRVIIDPRFHYAQFDNNGPAIPYLGFSNFENQRQNIYLSDETGRYNLQLENFQPKRPSNFQAALGAISAHIANQRNNQEYIPYPPNGDPYNYPAYRGHSRPPEPPALRAYERATNHNYGVQPVDFEQQNPRRIFSNNDYELGFSNQFSNPGLGFYNDANFFNNNGFQLRRSSEPSYRLLEEEYRRPVTSQI